MSQKTFGIMQEFINSSVWGHFASVFRLSKLPAIAENSQEMWY